MKRITSIFLCLLLLVSIPCIAMASDNTVIVNDGAHLLTDTQIQKLTEHALALKNEYGIDVLILTLDSLDGKSAQDYADDYLDYNGYSPDAIVLLLCMGTRDWHISTAGTAIRTFTDRDLSRTREDIIPYFSDGRYYDGFSRWLSYLDSCFSSETNTPTARGSHIALVSIIFGLVVALVTVGFMLFRMKTSRAQRNATSYIRRGSYRLTRDHDYFLYSRVSKTRKPEPSSSTTHTGSSGTSHGGGGGKF